MEGNGNKIILPKLNHRAAFNLPVPNDRPKYELPKDMTK
jgi:hypothetical protein